MTEETPAPESSPVDLGGGDDLEFGVAANDGAVVIRFNKLIQWFDMPPETAIALAEALITAATAVAAPNRAIRRATLADIRKLQ